MEQPSHGDVRRGSLKLVAVALGDAVPGELLDLVDADLGQAGEDSLAQGQFVDAHG
jgi:hypothetical protein